MKLNPMDLGVCGVNQTFYAGTLKFDTEGAAAGVMLCELPKNTIVVRGIAVVNEAFDASTSNTITVGKKAAANEIIGSSVITASSVGAYKSDVFVDMGEETAVYAKYAQSGDAAAAGAVDIYLEVVAAPQG